MMKLCLGSLLVLLPGASAAAAATQNVRSPPMVRRLSDRAAENLPARPLAIVPSLATIKTFEDGRATQYCMRRAAFATPRQLAGRLPVRSWDSDCAPRAPCALAGMELLGLLPCAQRRGRAGASCTVMMTQISTRVYDCSCAHPQWLARLLRPCWQT